MSVDILFVVTTPDASRYLAPLLDAADRASSTVAVFLTNDGVTLAGKAHLGARLVKLDTAVVCADSWSRFAPDKKCPITLGSQTDHSQLAGKAGKIISL